MLTRDAMIREARVRAGNLPGLLVVYSIIVATMGLTAMAML